MKVNRKSLGDRHLDVKDEDPGFELESSPYPGLGLTDHKTLVYLQGKSVNCHVLWNEPVFLFIRKSTLIIFYKFYQGSFVNSKL